MLATFSARVARLLATLPTVPAERWLSCRVPGARARFDDYVASRVVELAVHTDDLRVSVGAELEPDPEVSRVALSVALELARATSGDLAVLRAAFRAERGGSVLPVL